MLLQHLRMAYLYTVHLCQCSSGCYPHISINVPGPLIAYIFQVAQCVSKKARFVKERQLISQSTKKTWSTTVSVHSSELGLPPPSPNPSPSSECVPPLGTKGGRTRSPGGGGFPIRTTGEKPTTLPTLWLIPSALDYEYIFYIETREF